VFFIIKSHEKSILLSLAKGQKLRHTKNTTKKAEPSELDEGPKLNQTKDTTKKADPPELDEEPKAESYNK
jgi:hypothetical protein